MTVSEALARLMTAREEGRPCLPVRDLLPAGDEAAAYAVQSSFVAERLRAGARVVGRKIGLTHPEVQAQFGVDQPDFGVLFDDTRCAPGSTVDLARLLQPMVEAEIAFVLAHDLDLDEIGPADVAAATGAVAAALEIVDSRIAGWDIDVVDTVADNASAGLFVLGTNRVPLDGLDLAAAGMRLWRGDTLISAGSGAACLGNPVNAVAWLARTVRELGNPLRAGEIVLSGALGPVVPVAAGDRFRAAIDGVGEVEVAFARGLQPVPSDTVQDVGAGSWRWPSTGGAPVGPTSS